MQYYLMNKDNPVMLFKAYKNEFCETECYEIERYTDIIPLNFTNITDYLLSRQAPKHRKHISELLSKYNCNDIQGFIDLTYALSLNDTYWVKKINDNTKWDSISLYKNNFNELISEAAFDGNFSSLSLSTTSPEFGTDGYFAKCWIRENNKIMLYKSGSTTFEIEPYSEYLSNQIAEILKLDFIKYDLDIYRNKLISKCELFTNEKTGLIKAYYLLKNENRTLSSMLKLFSHYGSEDNFRRMCIFDSIILNTDRHLNNFGVLINNEINEIPKMAPVFDNNRSLLYDLDNSQLKNPEKFIKMLKPKIGVDFISNAKGMLTDSIKSDLKLLKDFEFTDNSDIEIDKTRLELLSEIIRIQVNKILN